MRILMAYEHYPCSIARFYRRAFVRLGHQVDSIGHSTGGRISWGPYDLSRWEDKPTYPLGNFSNVYEVGSLTAEIARGYDLFVNVDAACWFRGKLPIPKVIIGTDPHCLSYSGQRQDCDLFVVMQHYYSQPGDVWIPYAFDCEWHFHQDVPITHALTFYGVLYDNRRRDLQLLEAAGIRTDVGTGVVFDEGVPHYCAGHLAYCQPSLLDLPTRFFEALAYGTIPVLRAVPDLALLPEFRVGWHYETYEGEMDLIDVVQRTLADPRLEDRKADGRSIVQGHSWDHRATALLEACRERGLIE